MPKHRLLQIYFNSPYVSVSNHPWDNDWSFKIKQIVKSVSLMNVWRLFIFFTFARQKGKDHPNK